MPTKPSPARTYVIGPDEVHHHTPEQVAAYGKLPNGARIRIADIIDVADIRELAGVTTRKAVWTWRKDPTFPKPIRTTAGNIDLFDRRAVQAWLDKRAS